MIGREVFAGSNRRPVVDWARLRRLLGFLLTQAQQLNEPSHHTECGASLSRANSDPVWTNRFIGGLAR